MFWDGLNLESDLKTSEMQGIHIQVQTLYMDPFQAEQKRTKSSAVWRMNTFFSAKLPITKHKFNTIKKKILKKG